LARLNLTIPDALYERLDRFRDRVNFSRVCARALEKELAMLEGQATIENPRLQRLIHRLQRLQGNQERWYQRGREDGENWAVEVATQEELRYVDEEWSKEWLEDDRHETYAELDEGDLPKSFSLWPPVRKWLLADLKEAGAVVGNLPHARLGGEFAPAFEAARRIAEEESPAGPAPVRAVFDAFDRGSYLKGWHDAIREIWKEVSPLLRRPTE
jgi:hypothetical protein